jgi:DNA-binding NarL/FixJ family response regulator
MSATTALETALATLDRGGHAVLKIVGDPGLGKTRMLAELAVRAQRRKWTVRVASGVPAGKPDCDVLLLDDVHRADPPALARLLGAPPRLLALGYRPRQASAELLSVLRGAILIELGPLDAAEADELLPGPMSRSRRAALYQASGGNPFYLKALAECGGWLGPDLADELPPSVRREVLAEFAGLSPTGTAVAGAAAVVGPTVDVSLVPVAADLEETEALRGIDELVAHDLLRSDGSGPALRYRHPLLRSVAYHASGPGWRLGAHTRVADELARRRAKPVELAWHLERCARPAALPVLMEAAQTMRVRAPAVAARWLRAALGLRPEGALRVRLCFELARAQGTAGDLAGSRQTVQAVLDELPPGAAGRLEAVTFCAMLERLLGRHAEAKALLDAELAGHDGTEPASFAAFALEYAAGSLMRGDFAANRRWARHACVVARRHGNRPVQANALGFLAMACYAEADPVGASGQLDQAAGLLDAASDGELAGCLDATVWLGWNEVYLERYHDAVRHLDRGLRLARETGQGYLLPLLLACLVTALRWLGRLPEAAEHAEEAVAAARRSGSTELCVLALAMRSWVASWTGDLAVARSAGTEAVAASRGIRGWFAGVAAGMLARAELAGSQPSRCAEIVLAHFGGPELPSVDPRSRISWWEVLVRAELAAGRTSAAAAYARRAEDLADRLGLVGHLGHARLARAQVLAATGDRTGAARLAAVAAQAFAAIGCRLEAGRAHLLVGQNTADRPAAIDALQRARELFETSGADELARQAVRARRRLAARPVDPGPGFELPTSDPGPGFEMLTSREREIAELVTTGLTNQQIARRLSVTAKTVEKHLANVFAKLDVASRAAVASLVAGHRPSQRTSPAGDATSSAPVLS